MRESDRNHSTAPTDPVPTGARFAAPLAYAGTPGGGGHRAPAPCSRLLRRDPQPAKAPTRFDGDRSGTGSMARIPWWSATDERHIRPEAATCLRNDRATPWHPAPEWRRRSTATRVREAWCAARPVRSIG